MADTPLHLHPSVVHLMGTEHWPTDTDENGQHCRLAWEVVDDDGRLGWCFLRNQGSVLREVSNHLAHSLITLAAVRGMWDAACDVYLHRTTEGLCQVRTADVAGTIVFHPNCPTEPLAILAAYRATVMGKESSK